LHREELSVGLGGALPVEGLAGSTVELSCDAVEVSLPEAVEVRSFREIGAEQPDGLFGGAALLGAGGVAEEDL
jgi:hypothetical protein